MCKKIDYVAVEGSFFPCGPTTLLAASFAASVSLMPDTSASVERARSFSRPSEHPPQIKALAAPGAPTENSHTQNGSPEHTAPKGLKQPSGV